MIEAFWRGFSDPVAWKMFGFGMVFILFVMVFLLAMEIIGRILVESCGQKEK